MCLEQKVQQAVYSLFCLHCIALHGRTEASYVVQAVNCTANIATSLPLLCTTAMRGAM